MRVRVRAKVSLEMVRFVLRLRIEFRLKLLPVLVMHASPCTCPMGLPFRLKLLPMLKLRISP